MDVQTSSPTPTAEQARRELAEAISEADRLALVEYSETTGCPLDLLYAGLADRTKEGDQ
ncbi:hypothetical protein ACOKM3_14145 [Streptomyces sp. BH106]|uniref:hypothetical protein n=1 Tax=Streptomyces sp. BH106 TaxID=3410409 RepID=UPI003CEE36E1